MICPVCKKMQFELKHSLKCGCGFRIKNIKDTQAKKQQIALNASSM